jgi:hypothetical protein
VSYTPTSIMSANPESEEREVSGAKISVNLDLISNETKKLENQMSDQNDRIVRNDSELRRLHYARSFLFL